MRLSKTTLNNWTRLRKEDLAEIPTEKLLVEAGIFSFETNKALAFPPIGLRIVRNLENIIRTESEARDFVEVRPPILSDKQNLVDNGIYDNFKQEILDTQTSKGETGLVVTPTSEEPIFTMAYKSNLSYRQLPIRYFGFGAKARAPARVKGVNRIVQFTTADYTVLSSNQEDIDQSTEDFEKIVKVLIEKANIHCSRNVFEGGEYVDFLFPFENGEKDDSEGRPCYSLAMYHSFSSEGRSVPQYNSVEGGRSDVLVGTYGIGIERAVVASAESNRDGLGFAFPKEIAPFEVTIIPIGGNGDGAYGLASDLYSQLNGQNLSVAIDDRERMSLGARVQYAQLIGSRYIIPVGTREVDSGALEVKDRSGNSDKILKDKVVGYVKNGV